jgi:hypothetical protein
MFRPPFLKLPLIPFALVLAGCVAAHAQNPSAPDRPNSVICVLPGSTVAKPLEQRIKLAPGQKPLLACPPGATTYIDFSNRFPSVSNMPPPVVRPTTGHPP